MFPVSPDNRNRTKHLPQNDAERNKNNERKILQMMPYIGTYEETKKVLTAQWAKERELKVAKLQRKEIKASSNLNSLGEMWGTSGN